MQGFIFQSPNTATIVYVSGPQNVPQTIKTPLNLSRVFIVKRRL